jgi:hypothetical protein
LCVTREDFREAILKTIQGKQDQVALQNFAASYDWSNLYRILIEIILG